MITRKELGALVESMQVDATVTLQMAEPFTAARRGKLRGELVAYLLDRGVSPVSAEWLAGQMHVHLGRYAEALATAARELTVAMDQANDAYVRTFRRAGVR